MTDKECINRIKTGNFNNGYGFDMSLFVDTVGRMGELLRTGEVTQVIRCKKCKYYNSLMETCKDGRNYTSPDFFCADGMSD